MKQKCGANIHINLQSAKQFCVKFSQKMKTPHFFFKSPHYFRKSPHCLRNVPPAFRNRPPWFCEGNSTARSPPSVTIVTKDNAIFAPLKTQA